MTYTLDEAIESEISMVREDIKEGLKRFDNEDYIGASQVLCAAIAEMGALEAYETVQNGKVYGT